MEPGYLSEWGAAYILSMLTAVLLSVTAYKRPSVAKYMYGVLFIGACWANMYVAFKNPADYLNYSNYAWPIYREFIQGSFREIIQPMVMMIAIGQYFIGMGFVIGGPFLRPACLGSILFFAAITPLGLGAAFPFPLVATLGCVFIFWRSFEKKEEYKYAFSI